MAGQMHKPPPFHAAEHHPIVRALPTVELAADNRDTAIVILPGLFHVDAGWFDTYWYSERSEAKPDLIGGVVRCLKNKLTAVRQRHSVFYSRRDGRIVVPIPSRT